MTSRFSSRQGWTILIPCAALLGCEIPTNPVAFQATFALSAFQGKPLPLPDGGVLLIGDSLAFNEAARSREDSPPVIRATVVHRNPDGSETILRGFQSYQRHGDTVITNFSCRFSDICLAVLVPPEVGVIRHDSLVFSPGDSRVPGRVYLRTR